MCAALVVGNMIGSGIFLLPATLASYGTISLGGWLFTGAGAVLLALVFSRLSQLLPSTGGPYTFCRTGLGDFCGFLIAWGYWIGTWSGNAAIAVAMVGYLGIFFPIVTHNPVVGAAVAVSTIWAVTAINCRGVKSVGVMQMITTILKLLPLALVTLFGLFHINPEHFETINATSTSDFAALTSAASLCLWAFLGLESATVPSDDVHDPNRTIPRATILGTLFAAVLYILATISLIGLIDPAILAKSTAPFADGARMLAGPYGAMFVSAGAVISCFGALNGWTLMAAQIPRAAARDGLFPSVFGKLNSKGIPVTSILISSTLVSILVLTNFSKGLVGAFNFIISLAVMTTLLPYTMATIAKLVLLVGRRNKDNLPMLSTRDIVTTSLAFLYSLWALAGSGEGIVYWGFLLLMAGLPVYIWIEWQKRKDNPQPFIVPTQTKA